MTRSILQSCLGLLAIVVIVCGLVGCGQRHDSTASASEKNVSTFNATNFKADVLNSKEPVLVDFWAAWCGPCKMVAPIVAKVASEFEGKVKVGKVDVDAEPDLAKEYNISAIPALLIFKDGKQVDQIIGLCSEQDLRTKLTQYIDQVPAVTNVTKP